MKKIIFLAAIAATVSCNNDSGSASNSSKASASTNASVVYSYPISYSSQFEMADPKKAEKITQLWKDFDNNTLGNQANMFADTVFMAFPGLQFRGSRDSLLAMTQSYRNGYAKVESKIAAIMSTRSTDRNEDWVSVWGSEIATDKNGKVDSAALHEIWRFNKDGKIDYMSQFRQEYPTKR